MKAVAAIAVLCLRRWKTLPVGALLLGALGAWAHVQREAPMLPLAMTNFACLVALALFVPAVIAPTVGGARPDFLFSRPVGWWTVWLGRASAYVLIAVVALVCLALPPYVSHGVYSPWLVRPPLVDAGPPFLVLGGIAAIGYASYQARRPLATGALGLTLLLGFALLYLVVRAAAYALLQPGSEGMFWLTALSGVPVLGFSVGYVAVGRGEPVRAALGGAAAAALLLLPLVVFAGAVSLGWL